MDTEQNLPKDVIEAIRANRKIEAIKRLRESTGIGLKEAKHSVEAWQRKHPHLVSPAPKSNLSGGVISLVLLAVVGYAVYQYFG